MAHKSFKELLAENEAKAKTKRGPLIFDDPDNEKPARHDARVFIAIVIAFLIIAFVIYSVVG
jgi:hypothetical protein